MTLTEHLTLLTLIGNSKLKRPKINNRENAQKYNNNRNQNITLLCQPSRNQVTISNQKRNQLIIIVTIKFTNVI